MEAGQAVAIGGGSPADSRWVDDCLCQDAKTGPSAVHYRHLERRTRLRRCVGLEFDRLDWTGCLIGSSPFNEVRPQLTDSGHPLIVALEHKQLSRRGSRSTNPQRPDSRNHPNCSAEGRQDHSFSPRPAPAPKTGLTISMRH